MDPIFACSITWKGAVEDRPDEAWGFTDSDEKPTVLTLKDVNGKTEAGMFPLGATDESLGTPPIVGPWKMADSSLSSIGSFPRGSVALGSPAVGSEYFARILRLGNYPVTSQNVSILAEAITQLFLVKAWELIKMQDGQPRAEDFVARNAWNGEISRPEHVLSNLCSLYPQGISYLQDLPERVKGLLLEETDGGLHAVVWSRLSTT